AGDGDGADVGRFAACAQASVQSIQPMLGSPGDLEHVRRLALLTVCDRGPDSWFAQVVPGGLDQQPSRVAGAGLGDRALAAALTRLVERGYEPEPGAEPARVLEAREVADLEAEHERGQRVDAAETAQTCD